MSVCHSVSVASPAQTLSGRHCDVPCCRLYPFFKAFHHPVAHTPFHHQKVVRYVTYYEEPVHHHYQHPPSHSYHSEPSHSYSSYQIDRAGEGGQQEDDCYKLDSPYKELCLLCGREETQERRELCMEDPCLLAGKERELCNSLTDQYLDMFRHQQS